MSYLELLPAVDVKDGRAVRLVQGELNAETAYGSPLEAALDFQSSGAEWIHLVDLDAAFGIGENSALLAEVVGRLDIKVELSGGIRDDASLANMFADALRRRWKKRRSAGEFPAVTSSHAAGGGVGRWQLPPKLQP